MKKIAFFKVSFFTIEYPNKQRVTTKLIQYATPACAKPSINVIIVAKIPKKINVCF